MCLGTISEDVSANNMKKIELRAWMYEFDVDYKSFDISEISNIHKYLMEKDDIK